MSDPAAAPTNKRLVFLEKMTREGSTDPMSWYGLAMEYKSLGRHDESLQTFTQLRTAHPRYVAMYLMCGTMLDGLGRTAEAREWLEAGIAAAKAEKNSHALAELESALAALR